MIRANISNSDLDFGRWSLQTPGIWNKQNDEVLEPGGFSSNKIQTKPLYPKLGFATKATSGFTHLSQLREDNIP